MQPLWKCANVTASDRLGMADHGPVHIRIVVNIALRLLRLLGEAAVPFGVVRHYGLRTEDAEVVTVLAAALQDVGHGTTRCAHAASHGGSCSRAGWPADRDCLAVS